MLKKIIGNPNCDLNVSHSVFDAHFFFKPEIDRGWAKK
jgi:hypothetical protein